MQERLAKLSGGNAVKVGAATETERKEMKLRIEMPPTLLVQLLKKELPAGGTALVNVIPAVADLELTEMKRQDAILFFVP